MGINQHIRHVKRRRILKKGFGILNILMMSCFPYMAEAGDECQPKAGGTNICEHARAVVDEMAPRLPMKMSENLTMEKVFSFKNQVGINVILGYDETHLMSVAKDSGMSMEDITKGMKSSVKSYLCRDESPVSSFIQLGGEAKYIYKYSDGKPYLTVNIDEC